MIKDVIRKKLLQYDKLWVGFSGGIDSSVLLHVLSQDSFLKEKICPVHVIHGISSFAEEWATHAFEYCHQLGIELKIHRLHVPLGSHLESRARTARYAVFESLLGENDALLLAHHQRDVAETLLFHLLRGVGIDGLASIPFSRSLGKGMVIRPFLEISKKTIEDYANDHKLSWIEDESNQDSTLTRNFIRNEVLPLLETRFPHTEDMLGKAADSFKNIQSNLDDLALMDGMESEQRLSLKAMENLAESRQLNMLRFWLKQKGVRIRSSLWLKELLHQIITALSDKIPEISLEKHRIYRYQNFLYCVELSKNNTAMSYHWSDYPNPLTLQENQIKLLVKQGVGGVLFPKNVTPEIRYRVGGEFLRFHGQRKSLKKLFQEWSILPWQRQKIPLVYINKQLVAVVGYAVSDDFYSPIGDQIESVCYELESQ